MSLVRVVTVTAFIIEQIFVFLKEFCIYLVTPLSYPGGPRKRTDRRPQFDPKAEKRSLGMKWVYEGAEASVAKSEALAPGYSLTGIPAGRQTWRYVGEDASGPGFSPHPNPNATDIPYRTSMGKRNDFPSPPDASSAPAKTAAEAARKGVQYYQSTQCDDGHFAGDYGGPMFLMPGLIFTLFIAKTPIEAARRRAMILYLRNHQQIDGGWGMHIEGASTMFGTTLNYCALRLLGLSPTAPAAAAADANVSAEEAEENAVMMVRALKFIRTNGGAVMAPSWAKFWLACLGVYDWRGCNSTPPEMWLLPAWFPFHPSRLWCHCRMVYLPMCYLYGSRFRGGEGVGGKGALSDVVLQMRRELYVTPYDDVDWSAARRSVSHLDDYASVSPVMLLLHEVLAVYEDNFEFFSWLSFGLTAWAREKSLRFAADYMEAEDAQTNYVCIGPVNKACNMLCAHAQEPGGEAYQRHLLRVDDYLWASEDGVKMNGYNGSQLWDVAFFAQGLLSTGLCEEEEFGGCLQLVHKYIADTQIREDVPEREKWFRHISKGGWPFSTAAHGWPITDCTAEGLTSAVLLAELPSIQSSTLTAPIPAPRLHDAVNVLLSWQNEDGGWATYERTRGFRWYEFLNPSEVFGDIMIDYSYVECTAASIKALATFSSRYPSHRAHEIQAAIQRGADFITSIQRADGSWYGSWGVCFTYGTWFGVKGLLAAGRPTSSPAIQKACAFLASKQAPDGSWGESFLSCADKVYTPNEREGGQVVQTSWALLALQAGQWEGPNSPTVARGIKFLIDRQLSNGDWAQESISGVFNRSCGITYSQYRNIFPIWALGYYSSAHR